MALESLTWIVRDNVPDCVGVPPICPVVAFNVIHAGIEDPEVRDQV